LAASKPSTATSAPPHADPQVEQRLDHRGAQQRAVGEGHHHVAVEVGQGLAGGQHGVAGALGRVLQHGRALAQTLAGMLADLRAVGADHDDDALAVQGLGGVDGVVQQGPAADPVQHLGRRRLHPRALAGGQDDGRAPARTGARATKRRWSWAKRLPKHGPKLH
jgi:hypothetical protein